MTHPPKLQEYHARLSQCRRLSNSRIAAANDLRWCPTSSECVPLSSGCNAQAAGACEGGGAGVRLVCMAGFASWGATRASTFTCTSRREERDDGADTPARWWQRANELVNCHFLKRHAGTSNVAAVALTASDSSGKSSTVCSCNNCVRCNDFKEYCEDDLELRRRSPARCSRSSFTHCAES